MTWSIEKRAAARLVALLAAVALVVTGIGHTPAAQAASKKPGISWSYSPSTVRPGATVTVRYKVTKAPTGAKVALQYKKGKKWVKVKTLKRGSGTTKFKAAKKGSRAYRIVVTNRKGKVLRTSQKTIKVTPIPPKVTSIGLSASRVSENERITLRYGVVGVPGSASVKLQRAMGTAQKWADVMTLPKASAAQAVITAPTIGAHPYRIVVKNTKGEILAKSATRTVYAFRDIPLGEVMGWSSRTVEINGKLFRYVWSDEWFWGVGSYDSRLFKLEQTSCRRITLNAGFTASKSNAGAVGVIKVTQETADLQTMSVNQNETASGTFQLTGDAVDVIIKGYQTDLTTEMYINGSMSCYTLDGTR